MPEFEKSLTYIVSSGPARATRPASTKQLTHLGEGQGSGARSRELSVPSVFPAASGTGVSCHLQPQGCGSFSPHYVLPQS